MFYPFYYKLKILYNARNHRPKHVSAFQHFISKDINSPDIKANMMVTVMDTITKENVLFL